MLNDVSPLHMLNKSLQSDRSIDGRPPAGVSVSEGSKPSLLGERAHSPDRSAGRSRNGAQSVDEAVEFNREETSLHRLYRATRDTVEMSRGEKIAELRDAVKNGSYRPNLMVVAERLLSSGEVGLV